MHSICWTLVGPRQMSLSGLQSCANGCRRGCPCCRSAVSGCPHAVCFLIYSWGLTRKLFFLNAQGMSQSILCSIRDGKNAWIKPWGSCHEDVLAVWGTGGDWKYRNIYSSFHILSVPTGHFIRCLIWPHCRRRVTSSQPSKVGGG